MGGMEARRLAEALQIIDAGIPIHTHTMCKGNLVYSRERADIALTDPCLATRRGCNALTGNTKEVNEEI